MDTKGARILPPDVLTVAGQNIANKIQTGFVSGGGLDVFGHIRPGTSQATRVAVGSALNRIGDGSVDVKPKNGKK